MPSNMVQINGSADYRWEIPDTKMEELIRTLDVAGERQASDDASPWSTLTPEAFANLVLATRDLQRGRAEARQAVHYGSTELHIRLRLMGCPRGDKHPTWGLIMAMTQDGCLPNEGGYCTWAHVDGIEHVAPRLGQAMGDLLKTMEHDGALGISADWPFWLIGCREHSADAEQKPAAGQDTRVMTGERTP